MACGRRSGSGDAADALAEDAGARRRNSARIIAASDDDDDDDDDDGISEAPPIVLLGYEYRFFFCQNRSAYTYTYSNVYCT